MTNLPRLARPGILPEVTKKKAVFEWKPSGQRATCEILFFLCLTPKGAYFMFQVIAVSYLMNIAWRGI